MQAAASVGPAARPLPLFYALSQAGRAIAAARLPNGWELSGHGLKWSADTDLLESQIKPNPSKRKTDSFAGVAAAIGSERLSRPVKLGALWSALPDLLFPGPPDRRWRLPLRVVADYDEGGDDITRLFGSKVVQASVMGFPAVEPNAERILAELEHYPTAADGQPVTAAGTDKVAQVMVPGLGILPLVRWSAGGLNAWDHQWRLDEIAPEYRQAKERYAIPRLEQGDFLEPLMLWWGLLFGLSNVARYEPALWVKALDVDNSQHATPLEVALDEALLAVPQLILSALLDENVITGKLARWPASVRRTKREP